MTEATLLVADTGAAPEPEIARDLAKRASLAGPVFVAVGALVDGADGAASAGLAVAIVLVNFLVAASSLAWAARINLAVLMGVSLFGYLLRLGVLFGIFLLLQDVAWIHEPTFGLTLIVTHLGLLAWELKYVSATLAHPALKPTASASTASKENHR